MPVPIGCVGWISAGTDWHLWVNFMGFGQLACWSNPMQMSGQVHVTAQLSMNSIIFRLNAKLCDDSVGLDGKGFAMLRESVAGVQLCAT